MVTAEEKAPPDFKTWPETQQADWCLAHNLPYVFRDKSLGKKYLARLLEQDEKQAQQNGNKAG
jgi:hypothetical protein